MSAVYGNDFAGFGDFGGSPNAMAALTSGPAPNMTVVGKKPARGDVGGRDDERVVTARQNDKLDDVLMRQGSTREDARAIAAAFGSRSGYGTMALQAGQVVRILTAQEGGRLKPLRVAVESGSTESIVALSDMGEYVSVADSQDIAQTEGENFENVQMAGGPGELSLYQSFYGTALAKGVPKAIINELVEVFSYDADFQRKASSNDGFEVLFASDDAGQVDGPTEILYSSLISGSFGPQIPDAKADSNRADAVRLRHAPPSHSRLFENAYGRRFRRAARNADLFRRQRHRHAGQTGRRIWQSGQGQACQRL
jgi:hypothetical protein